MKMRVIYSNGILEYKLQKELYTKEVILDAIANSIIFAFTDSNGKDVSLQMQNVIAIELY